MKAICDPIVNKAYDNKGASSSSSSDSDSSEGDNVDSDLWTNTIPFLIQFFKLYYI